MWKVPGILLSSGLLRPCFWRYHRALRRNGILELLGHLDGTLNPSAGAAPGGTVNITVQYVDKAVMMAGPAAMATCETRWPGAGCREGGGLTACRCGTSVPLPLGDGHNLRQCRALRALHHRDDCGLLVGA